jgi:hypothetical protein
MNLIFARALTAKSYWRVRRNIDLLGFYVARFIHNRARDLSAHSTDSRAIRGIARLVFPSLTFAAAVAALTQFSAPHIEPLAVELGWDVPENGIYGAFLGGVTSIGSVFIGLYYAGLTAIGSAAYAKYPGNVRELLIREQIGNAYMKYLAFLTFYCLCMLALRVVGYPYSPIAIPVVAILSGVGIYGFIALGQRAFYLFDPVQISDTVFVDLGRWLRRVGRGGFRWNHASFQQFAHKSASGDLDAIHALHRLCLSEQAMGNEPQLALLRRLAGFLIDYSARKASIPVHSRWFPRIYEHRSWYGSDDSRVAVAHQTGTSLQPEEVVDKDWIENSLLPVFERAAAFYLSHGDKKQALEVINLVRLYARAVSNCYRPSDGTDAFVRFAHSVVDNVLSTPATDFPEDLETLALVESTISISIDICVAYGQAVTLMRPANLASSVAMAVLYNRGEVKRQGYVQLERRADQFSPKIDFERKLLHTVITPGWYMDELFSVSAAEGHKQAMDAMFGSLLILHADLLGKTRDAGRLWLHAAVLSRQREYLAKLEHWVPMFQSMWEELLARRSIDGIRWPHEDFGSRQLAISAAQTRTWTDSQSVLSEIATSPRPSAFPDYFGQFLHAAGEDCLRALLDGKSELVGSLFPLYFIGCLLTFQSVLTETRERNGDDLQAARVAAGVVLDLIDLSGYALLLSRYHDDPGLWTYIKSSWDRYLSDPARPPQINAIMSVGRPMMMIPMRGILRTTWAQSVSALLRELPRREAHHRGSNIPHHVSLIEHPDPLVRVIASDRASFLDGIDIFGDLYLVASYPELFQHSRHDVSDMIRREEELHAKFGK